MAVLRIHAPVLGREERVLEWDGRPLVVGRDEGCDVVLLEQAASRRHARLEQRGDAYLLTDLESANGVRIGPTKVEGTRELHDGDVIHIGDTTLTLVLDPHRQPTLYRSEAPSPAIVPRDDLGSGPTLAAPAAAALDPAPAPAAALDPAPAIATELGAPAAAAPLDQAPAPSPPPPLQWPATASPPRAASVYSLGSDPTLAAPSGPASLGALDRSSPSAYSLGSDPALAEQSSPVLFGAPDRSSPSAYSLGSEPALTEQSSPVLFGAPDRSSPSAYSLGSEPTLAAPSGPASLGAPDRSSPSAYSLGSEPTRHGAPGPHLPSSGSVYSMGPAPAVPPADDVLRFASTGSVYLLGDAPAAVEPRGPDVLPPAPVFDGVASSFQLGVAPPAPGAFVPAPPAPPRVDPQPPPAFVAPAPARSAASSWEWAEPLREDHRRRRHRRKGAVLWLGLVLLVGGIVAMVVAVAAGYDPHDLASLLGWAHARAEVR